MMSDMSVLDELEKKSENKRDGEENLRTLSREKLEEMIRDFRKDAQSYSRSIHLMEQNLRHLKREKERQEKEAAVEHQELVSLRELLFRADLGGEAETENSDLFVITVYYLEYFKPFKSKNIIYLLKTKTYKRRKSIDFHSRSLKTDYVKPNIFIELSDCSSILFEYINDTFKLSLEYKEILSDNDDEMNTLNEFENEKIKKFINLAEEGGKRVCGESLTPQR